jgi:serine/threonine protein kinase
VKRALSEPDIELLGREAAILERVKHPLIIRSLESFSDASSEKNPQIVMELAGHGTLANYVSSKKERAKRRLRKLLLALLWRCAFFTRAM